MSRGKTKQLLDLLTEANVIIDILHRDNKELKKRNKELEESCENFSKAQRNSHKKVAEIKENKSLDIRKRLMEIWHRS